MPRTNFVFFDDALGSLGPGDHAGFIYSRPERSWQVAVPFLSQGLARGELVCYLGEAQDLPLLAHLLEDEGLDVAAFRQDGRLLLLEASSFCNGPGAYDLSGIIDLCKSRPNIRRAEGCPGVRAACNASWMARQGRPELEVVAAYERLVNQELIPHFPLTCLCLYDRDLFPPPWQDMVCQTHPCLLTETGLYRQELA